MHIHTRARTNTHTHTHTHKRTHTQTRTPARTHARTHARTQIILTQPHRSGVGVAGQRVKTFTAYANIYSN